MIVFVGKWMFFLICFYCLYLFSLLKNYFAKVAVFLEYTFITGAILV